MSARPFVASLVLFAASVVVGTAVDDVPARPLVQRAGYRVLEADFHAHTRFSDGLLAPPDLVLQARRRGLDALAITEHQLVFPGQIGRAFARATGGPTILVGEEITTNRYHLIAVGLTSRVHAGDPLGVTIEAIHAQGGVAIAAHPVRRYWERFDTALTELDGTEVMHPQAYGSARLRAEGSGPVRTGPTGWNWEDMRTFYEDAITHGHRLTAIGSSDFHGFSPLGVTRTLVFVERDDEEGVLDALKKGRTVVYDLEGRAYGDPELIRALEKEPYEFHEVDYNYRGTGLLDRAARLVGWLSLVGLILFARPRRGETTVSVRESSA